MLPCWLSRVFCDEGMCFYLTENVATNDMFLQYINNKHYKISPSGRNDEAIREKEGRKDGGEAAIFSSHNIHLAVTPTKEDSYKKKPLSKFETLTKITSQRNNAQPINSRALSHYALCIMHS